jgi:CheY-like chemotaxis protein
MGGQLTVISVVGKGSVFRVDLPLVEAKVERSPTPLPQVATGPRKPVLVVDDNPINLVVARGLVERAGYEVQVAKNGVEAVAAVAQHDFGMVFMDCQMPEMDGLEATRRIRASSEHPQTVIVALTASGLPEELDACRQAGMNDCLVKPVSFAMVERALALAR